jgi:hypothetical protein
MVVWYTGLFYYTILGDICEISESLVHSTGVGVSLPMIVFCEPLMPSTEILRSASTSSPDRLNRGPAD